MLSYDFAETYVFDKQSPGPGHCGPLLERAPLLPKLRGHFAEFLNEGSLARLRILSLPTCVGLRYGHYLTSLLETISWQYGVSHFATITAAPHHLSGLMMDGFAYPSPYGFDRVLPITRMTYPAAKSHRSRAQSALRQAVVQEYEPVVHPLRLSPSG